MENSGITPVHSGCSQTGTKFGPDQTGATNQGGPSNQTGATSQQCSTDNGPRASPLAVLQEVQKAYEDRLQLIDRIGGSRKLEMTVDVLRAWVSDLVGQNALLARVVEDLEVEATNRLIMERNRHLETEAELQMEMDALQRRLARKDSDLRGLIEVLRRLREFDYCTLDGIHFYEVTETDIFGTVAWRQKKLEQGDLKRSFWNQQTKETIDKENKFF